MITSNLLFFAIVFEFDGKMYEFVVRHYPLIFNNLRLERIKNGTNAKFMTFTLIVTL